MYGALPLHPDFMIVYGALPHTPQTLSFEKGFDPKELAWNYFCLDLFGMMTTKAISITPVGPSPTRLFND